MILRQELQLKNEWWINNNYKPAESMWPARDLFSVLEANLEHPLMLNIVGLRRVGKSTILKQLIGKLLHQSVEPINIFYFLFDYASQIKKPEFLDEVLSAYFSGILGKPNLSLEERSYVFLDEIQYIDDWQAVIKKYYDLSGKKIKFILTGSQSVLLKGKSKESLAGRIFDFYLPPLSFLEFLKINREEIKPIKKFDLFDLPQGFNLLSQYDAYYGRRIADLSREYITVGQFPEIRQLSEAGQRHEYIKESVLGKVLEDCIRVFKIEKADEFKLFAYQLLHNAGSIFELKNIGREIAVSKLTLEKYLEHLKDGYIVEVLYKYHKSPVKRGRISKKLYARSVNFICALNRYTERHVLEAPQAFGKIIENVIYNILALKYQIAEYPNALSFWRQGEKEIDFIILSGAKRLPVEVKFSNNINTKETETMIRYMSKNALEYGVVVTRRELDKKIIRGKAVYFIPYYLILMIV